MTEEETMDAGALRAQDAVLEVLTNEGWVADPDATDYNLRVAALIVAAARRDPEPGGLDAFFGVE